MWDRSKEEGPHAETHRLPERMTVQLDLDVDPTNSTLQFEEEELRDILETLAVGLDSLNGRSSLPTQSR